MAFQQDSMSTTGLQRGGSTSVAQPPGGAKLLGGTSGAATLAPGGRPMKPQAPNQPPRQDVIYTPGVNGPVVNSNTVPQQNLILPSPMTPQPTQQAQVGQYPPPPLKAAGYQPAWLKIALARLKSAAQLPAPRLPSMTAAPAGNAPGAQTTPSLGGLGGGIQNTKPAQSPILRADTGTKTMAAPRTAKMAAAVANNQDGKVPSKVDIGRKIRVVNGRMEGHGIDALYDDPEISSRMRGFKKRSSLLFPLHRPVNIKAALWPFGQAAPAKPQYSLATGTPLKNRLLERIVRTQMGIDPKHPLYREHEFRNHLGYDDLDTVESIMDLEEETGKNFNDDDVDRITTLGGLSDYMKKLPRAQPNLVWSPPSQLKAAAWPNMMGNTQSTDASMGRGGSAMSLAKPGALQGATQNPNIDFAPSGIKGKGGGNAALGGGGGAAGSIGDMMGRFNAMKPALPRANSGAAAANSLVSPSEDLSPVRRGTGAPSPLQFQPGTFQSGQRPQFQTTPPGPLSGMLKRFAAEVGEAWSNQAS